MVVIQTTRSTEERASISSLERVVRTPFGVMKAKT